MLFFETLYKCEFYTVVSGLAEIMFAFKLAPSAMKAHTNIMRRKENKNYRQSLKGDEPSDTNQDVFTRSSFKVFGWLRLSLQILQKPQLSRDERAAGYATATRLRIHGCL